MKQIIYISILCLFMTVPAWADIILKTGAVNYGTPIPTLLTLDATESNTDIFVFDEKQNLTLTSNLSVDIAKAGLYKLASDLTGAGGTISAGTIVNSYIVHVDPVGTPSGLITYDGSITLSNKILGVIVQTPSLIATDSILGAAGTTYSNDSLRGLEWNQDWVELSVSLDGMTMQLKTSNKLDEIRVIELVPVPAAMILGLLGLGVAGIKLRKYA